MLRIRFHPTLMLMVLTSSVQAVTLMDRSDGLEVPQLETGKTELEIGDIDGDGNLDIVSLGDHGNPGSGQEGIMVWFGNGEGSWSLTQEGDFGYGGCALGDLNGDGRMDIAWGQHHDYGAGGMGDRLINAALGNGTGSGWVPWDEGLAENGESWGMFATDVADFDNDGLLDVICQSFGASNGVRVYRNLGDGSWQQEWQLTGQNADFTLETGDFDADGNIDFICTRWGGGEYTNIFLGDGSFGFTLAHGNIPQTAMNAVDTGDYDRDGRCDILVSFASDSGVRVYSLNESSGDWDDRSTGLPGGSAYSMVNFGDLNGDGYLDVMVYARPQGTVYLGDGQGNWTADAVFSFSTPGHHSALRSGWDFDHDGRHDIVVQAAEGTIYTYTNRLMALSPWQAPATLNILGRHPAGGECFPAGSVRFIDWTTAVPQSTGPVMVKIEFSQNGPAGPWVIIADGIPDNGRFQWTVPQVNSAECRLRLTAFAGSLSHQHITSEDFSVMQLTGVQEKWSEPVPPVSVRVIPNPAPGAATVTLDDSSLFTLTVIDLSGRVISRVLAEEGFASFGEGLPAGIYTILVESDGVTAEALFVKL